MASRGQNKLLKLEHFHGKSLKITSEKTGKFSRQINKN